MNETSPKKRGRPRLASTIARDELVFAALDNEQLGRQQVADLLTDSVNAVYLSLARLQASGRVHKVRAGKLHLWTQTYQG